MNKLTQKRLSLAALVSIGTLGLAAGCTSSSDSSGPQVAPPVTGGATSSGAGGSASGGKVGSGGAGPTTGGAGNTTGGAVATTGGVGNTTGGVATTGGAGNTTGGVAATGGTGTGGDTGTGGAPPMCDAAITNPLTSDAAAKCFDTSMQGCTPTTTPNFLNTCAAGKACPANFDNSTLTAIVNGQLPPL